MDCLLQIACSKGITFSFPFLQLEIIILPMWAALLEIRATIRVYTLGPFAAIFHHIPAVMTIKRNSFSQTNSKSFLIRSLHVLKPMESLSGDSSREMRVHSNLVDVALDVRDRLD